MIVFAMNTEQQARTRRIWILLSPFVILLAGHLTARFGMLRLGTAVWIPLSILFCALFAGLVWWGGGMPAVRRWIAPASSGPWWTFLAIAIGCVPLTVFLAGWNLFPAPWMVFAWLLFAVVNGPLEEFYWRGLLLDATSGWPPGLGVLFTSVLFAVNHPLSHGQFSIANRHPAVLISTFAMGLIWALTYRKTRSLRWPIFAHILTDLLGLSVLAFENIVVPRAMP
jgi:hypothetical protein